MNNLALSMAYNAHKNQIRKGSDIPYIVHPVEVAVILINNGASEDQITAGILHDTLEDTDLTIEEIKDNFGENVARLVVGASEPSKIGLSDKMAICEEKATWKERKVHTIQYLSEASEDIQLICCADKLSNIRSMKKDYDNIGNELWKRFNASCEEQKWYYEGLVKSLKGIYFFEAYKEFVNLVNDLFTSKEVIKFMEESNVQKAK